MVLDAGRIVRSLFPFTMKFGPIADAYCVHFTQVEFDKPNELLKNREGRLRALVDDSGDREALYHMADADAEMS